jgi:4,5-dihydroxyphthalate decarboxylase
VERAASDKALTRMLLEGEVDAAIYGADVPTDPRLKSVIPDPEVAAQGWYRKYGFSPINHMVVIKEAVVRENPQIVKEVYQLLLASKRAAGHGTVNDIDMLPFGIAAVRPALERIIDYAAQQQVIARRLSVDQLFDDVARTL